MAFTRHFLPSLLMAALVAGCSGQAQDTDPRMQAPLVIQDHVRPQDGQERRFLGRIGARVDSPLGFRVGGKVQERLVQNGDRVTEGQVLMTLDPKDLKLDHQARLAAVQAAQAQAAQAQADLKRMQLLVDQGAVSRQAYEQSRHTATSAQANLRSAQAQADISRNADQYSSLKADADGIITEQLADVGQVVAAGQAVLRLAHDGPRDVLVSLPEQLNVPQGTLGQIELPGQAALWPVRLRELAQSSDPATRSFQARFALEDERLTPRLGSSAILYLELPHDQPLTQVPLTALYDAGQGPGVWVIGDDRSVQWHSVRIARLAQENAYLSQGPQAGTPIVALGANLLHEGQQVRPQARKAAE